MNQQIEELFPFYALGTLTDEERAQIENYIAHNPEARSRLEEMQQAVAALPLDATPVTPSTQVKTRLMAQVKASKETVAAKTAVSTPAPSFWQQLQTAFERLRLHPAMPVFAAACLVVALAAGWWAIRLNRQLTAQEQQTASLQTQITTLEGQLTTLQQTNAALEEQIGQREDTLAAIFAPGAHTVTAAGLDPQPQAVGKLVVNTEGNSAVFLASNLSPLPSDKVYQLWLIQGDQPVGMGTFQVDEHGYGKLVVMAETAVSSFTAVGVSIEPTGGSSQPTGDIVLLGTISS